MSEQTVSIRFQPGGRIVRVKPGTGLMEAAALAGMILNTPCGGMGKCGKCRVRFLVNLPSPGEADIRRLTGAELEAGWRLGCQTQFLSDAEVELPAASLLGGEHQIQAEGHKGENHKADGDVRKFFLQLSPPTLADGLPDLLRMERALREIGNYGTDWPGLHAPASVLRTLGSRLRAGAFSGTVTTRNGVLIDYEQGDTAGQAYGLAFDIGTTTLVGALVHLASGEEVATVSDVNPQVKYGDDVLSRIAFASRDDASLAEIRACLLEQLRTMIVSLGVEANVSAGHIYEAAFAGNTTMQHILAGYSPASLGMVPFVPVFGRSLVLDEDDFHLGIHPNARIHIFPVIGGFVGGDTVAGMLAAELRSLDGPVLMLDIGTNGEIVLVYKGRILAASTAAGPAFEGARISCGMRATTGAVEKVVIHDDVELGVIGNVQPRGLCGSGLIDLCGQLLKAGCLAHDGRLLTVGEAGEAVSASLRQRMRLDNDGAPEFVIAQSGEQALTLTQRDVRELQLGAGAIRAGVSILMKQAGLEPVDLQQILIAGGFGSFIRRDNAQRIGLIPHEVPHEKVRFIGNVAFSGAKWAVISGSARQEAERLARCAEHVELSQDPDFAMEFAMAMRFPGEESDR
ncbi:MAG: DUF4445 domain-containing protein [Candidatus Hydrogenedentes bacterium]|nr:DUF4445 domain-containing protein [Candidatus Hydrogenedentota bacterium]